MSKMFQALRRERDTYTQVSHGLEGKESVNMLTVIYKS